jgi:hypothetical protein
MAATIQLTDQDLIELEAALDVIRLALNVAHGTEFFATSPFQTIGAKLRYDLTTPRATEIHLTDIELGALKTALHMLARLSGTPTPPIYDKVDRELEKRASTLGGKLSLIRAVRRSKATGLFGLQAVADQSGAVGDVIFAGELDGSLT